MDARWGSELHSGRIVPLLLQRRDEDARTAAEIAVALANSAKDQYALAKAYTAIGEGFARFYSDYDKALPYLNQALVVWREIGATNEEAQALRSLAEAYQFNDQYDKARDFYQQAVTLNRKLNNRSGEGFALLGLAESYRLARQPEAAVPFYQQTLQLSREVKNRGGEGYALLGLADCYRALNQYEQALSFYDQAVRAGQEVQDRPLTALALAGLGDAYRYVGNYTQALPLYEQTLRIRQDLLDRRGAAYTLNALAQCARMLNQLRQVVGYYDQMRTICREIKDRRGESLALVGLANGYRSLQQHTAAVASYEEALMALRQLKDRRGEYQALIGIAAAHRNLGSPMRALPYLEQAAAINTELKEAESSEALFLALGATYYALKNYDQALAQADKLQQLPQQSASRFSEGVAALLQATTWREKGDASQATARYQAATAAFQAVKNLTGEAFCQLGQAELAYRQRNLAQALKLYERATQLLDQAQQQQLVKSATTVPPSANPANPNAPATSAETFSTDTPGVLSVETIYNQYLELLAAQQDFATAVLVAERWHNYQLYQELSGNKNLLTLAQQKLAVVSVDKLKPLAQQLNSNILRYIPTANGLFTILIKPDGAIVGNFQALPAAQLAEIVVARRSTLEPKNSRSDKLRTIINEVLTEVLPTNSPTALPNNIYNIFFPEAIASALPTEAEARLLLVTPGQLATIPFSDLTDGQGRRLADRFTLATTNSITTIVTALSNRKPVISDSLTIVGNPLATQLNNKPLATLDDAKEEVSSINSAFKGRVLTDKAATIGALTTPSENSTGQRILHFATFAYFSDQKPLASFLLLAPETDVNGNFLTANTIGGDGVLRLENLPVITTNNELLFFSTAQVGTSGGNGLGISLLQDITALAGCPTTIYTLWPVENKVAATFTKAFYEKFKKTSDLAGSFRTAQIKTREKFASPAQWAAFVLAGNLPQ
jgi:CHAT domain-containing protein